jgi:hypothetical protein
MVYDNPTGLLPIISCGARTIPLYKKSSVVSNTLVSEQDYPKLVRHRWSANWDRTMKDYQVIKDQKRNGQRTWTSMAREILGMSPKQGVHADHADHVNFDIRDHSPSNLRVATFAQSMAHRRMPSKRSPYKCVDRTPNGKYRGRAYCKGRTVAFPSMNLEVEAGFMAWHAGKTLYGEFYHPAHFSEGDVIDGARQDVLKRMVHEKLTSRGLMP